ncbi:MAG TPA: FG-GAP-like repeat-containing protein, partial [Kofleriaceae bacterium]|nr:FG-GAP-like repeat-containing protein [Kofleriaceae bacterium]
DQTCVVQDDNALVCFGIGADRKELWWWFTQGAFLSDSEDFIIGDYTGDGRDDVLVYPRAGGAWRMYSLTGDYFFGVTPGFAPGNLGTAVAGQQVRAGDFNADGRDDVALINGAGQILYYVSVYASSQHTFWWAFTTGAMVTGNDQVTIARIDDDNDDDVVLRNRVTGVTRFFRMEYAGASLPAITHVPTGQLSASGNSLLFWGAMHDLSGEPGATRRDDALVYELGWNGFVRSDARFSGTQLTYWWAYSQVAPDNHAGWPAITARPWLFLKCKFSDIATTPRVDQFYRDMVFGTWGLAHYWFDNSYGAWDAYSSTVRDTWYGMGITNAAWIALPTRWDRAGACMNAYGGSTAGFVNTINLVNGEGDAGNHGGRVLMTPGSSNSTFLAHETGHTFGYWDHSWDDSGRRNASWSGPGEYYDHWDIMSAMNVHAFTTSLGAAGPGINTPYLHKMSFIPAHRRVQLNSSTSSQSVRMNLAALGRPEASGPLYVRIGSNDADHYTVEYRMKSGWDQGIPRATVLVHRVSNGISILLTANGGPERLPGTTSWFWTGTNWISVAVHGFAAEGYTADVTIGY